jgi:hypothetical protein
LRLLSDVHDDIEKWYRTDVEVQTAGS